MQGKIFKNEFNYFDYINIYLILKLREHLFDEFTVVIIYKRQTENAKKYQL
jgi:hypothetical protein